MTETTPEYVTKPQHEGQPPLPEKEAVPPPNTERARFSITFQGARQACLIRAGTANGYIFSADVLKEAVTLFEGRPCFTDHADFSFFGPSNRSVHDLAGHIQNAHWSEQTQGIVADIHFYATASWLRELAEQAQNHEYFGLSADLWLTRKEQTVQRITSVESVDVVIHPAAGGTFAIPAEFAQKGNHVMPENLSSTPIGDQTPIPAPPPAVPPVQPDAAALQRQLALLTIQTAGLPQRTADALRAQYEATPCSPGELEQRIALAKQIEAARAELTAIQGLGQIRTMDSIEKVSLAFQKLMGVEGAQNADVHRLTGIREFYDLLTGDHERHGVLHPERVNFANVTTSTVTSIVANTLNKILLRAYEMRFKWWQPIVTEVDMTNMNTIKWITLGGVADLDTVAEGAAYTEKSWGDAEETSDFTKKGNYLGITLEAIDRDDVAAIRQLPRKLGIAAARTLAAAVAALFSGTSGTGPLLADGVRLFSVATHANLLTTALSADAWDAVIQAMFKQAEHTSAKRLGIRPRYCLVPIELEKTALTIFASDKEPGMMDNDANVRRMSDAVITVPEWTDASDWAAAASPLDLEGVCIGYRYGRAPEIFVADSDLTGSMFTNDEMRIKVRFIYAVGIGDFRALHKSNVS
jgi:hypothetical protein